MGLLKIEQRNIDGQNTFKITMQTVKQASTYSHSWEWICLTKNDFRHCFGSNKHDVVALESGDVAGR